MKKITYFTLFCSLLSFSYQLITTCPLCIGKLDKEQTTPPFFSDEYDRYWQLTHQENAHLLKEIYEIEEEKENS